MAANKVERLSPRYVAFRTMQKGVVVPVIARIESHRAGRWWGYWFSKRTPDGLFTEVPVEQAVALERKYRDVEVIAGDGACDAARSLANLRLLSVDVALLPLTTCDRPAPPQGPAVGTDLTCGRRPMTAADPHWVA